jgi:nitrate/nitrite transporter NarK
MTYFNGLAGLSGWQWMFIVEGGLTMLMGPILLFGLTNSIDSAKWLSLVEKQTAQRGLARLNQTAHAHSYRDAVFNAKTAISCLAYFSLLVGYYGIAFWLPQLIKHAGVSDTMTIGWLSALPWLAAGVTVVFVGPYSDVAGRRGAVRTGAMLLTAAGFWISAYFASSVALSLLGLTMAAVGILAASTVFWADLARVYVGPAAAIGFAVINSIGNLGGFFSPYMLGFVTDLTGSAVMGMYAIVASILISCALMFVAFRSLRN